MDSCIVLKFMKPLHVKPESGLHWYITYIEHSLTVLDMKRYEVDPCMLLKRDRYELLGVISLQVKNRFGFCDNTFLKDE